MPDRGGPDPTTSAHPEEASGSEIRTPAAPAAVTHGEPIDLAAEPFSLTGNDDPEDDPAPRSPIRRIILNGLLLVGVAGFAVLGWAAWQVASQKDATVSAPARIGALRLDDSQNGRDTADYLKTALAAEVDVKNATGAVYIDNLQRNVLFFGGTALIWSPGADLKTAFGLISDDQGAVTNIHDVSAGKLGGTMRCGTTKTDDGPMSVCGWADHGSLALAMFPGRSEQDSAALLRQIRDATQTRR